jgi:predicted metal-binding membrane protein
MIAFWITVVIAVVVAVVYVTLAVQSFLRVRRDVLALAASGETVEIDTTGLDDDGTGFAWKALGAVVVSTSVIVLLGVSPVFWYLPVILAIGTAVAVIAAFIIDRRSAE